MYEALLRIMLIVDKSAERTVHLNVKSLIDSWVATCLFINFFVTSYGS